MAIILVSTLIIIALAMVLLSFTLLFRGKSFPSGHIEDNPALKAKGIHCANSQLEQEARRKNLFEQVSPQQPTQRK